MNRRSRAFAVAVAAAALAAGPLLLAGCSPEPREAAPASAPAVGPPAASSPADLESALLVALAALEKGPDGKPKPLPAELGILSRRGGAWTYRAVEDPDSNVFHKALAYQPAGGRAGLVTFGGTGAFVKLWRSGQPAQVLWTADFGGRFSRMRDGEVADLYGDGRASIAVATHDQGVVAVLHPDGAGGFEVKELDREANTFVHEIEVGDLDGDGVPEVYATPSEPNKADGTPQPGKVVRYVPARGEGRVEVADLGDRHAKEILVHDVDGDGRDELYVAVEAVSGGQVEIRRYDGGTPAGGGGLIATLDDSQCRFLTAGDVDGDGRKELVAAAFKSGLWLLRPGAGGQWLASLIDRDSGGFEHAAILADLDVDGSSELYVSSDNHKEIRRYVWVDGQPRREVIHKFTDGRSRFTWNLMPAPVALLP